MLDILIPTDRIGNWGGAVRYAAQLALKLHGSLTGLHVVQPVQMLPSSDSPMLLSDVLAGVQAHIKEACAAGPAFCEWAGGLGVKENAWSATQSHCGIHASLDFRRNYRGFELAAALWIESNRSRTTDAIQCIHVFIVSTVMATSIRLDPEIEQRLDHLAGQTGRTKAYYLRELVTNGLDDLEDYYLAAATMERVRKGEEAVYSAAQVRNDLGLDD